MTEYIKVANAVIGIALFLTGVLYGTLGNNYEKGSFYIGIGIWCWVQFAVK